MTALARLALLLAALACWRGGSRRVTAALLVVVAASTASTLPLPAPLPSALYLVVPAASAWLALRVAVGRGWLGPVIVAATAVLALWCARPGTRWAHAIGMANVVSIALQLCAVDRLRRPLGHEELSVIVLLAGDVAAAVLATLGAPWWLTQGQTILVALALAWIHHDVFRCARV